MATREKSLRQLSEEMGVADDQFESSLVDISEEPETFELEDGSRGTVEMLDDGGAEVSLGPEDSKDGAAEAPFGANLSEYMEKESRGKLSAELINLIRADERSRQDWEETYKKGLKNLGLKIEERSEPWPGACAAVHPMLGESVVRFQAQTIGEIFPAQGPVKSMVVGTITPEKEKQAKRVQDYMNYVILNQMVEYRPETEKMLFSLPLAGSAFRKIYFDPTLNRPTSVFCPAEDVIVNYAATSIQDAERITHVMRRSDNEVRKLQVSGFYRDLELKSASPDYSTLEDAKDTLVGRSRSMDTDTRRVLYEVHVDLDLEGFEDETGIALPYVVTVDNSDREILSIRRNWKEGDPKQVKRQHFVHYEFIPGLGFYGFGLVHLIGGLASASTSLLRQLIDAGTLANLQGGFKTRGLRIQGDDSPILPGEWRDVDVASGTLKENIMAVPAKEPSAALLAMLQTITEDGRRFASMADLKVADMNQEAPVGTTLAIMEKAMKVQSAIQARIHAGLKIEYKMLAEVISTQTEPAYPYEIEEGAEIKAADFDERVDIIPVSDPNAGTMAQRIMQKQAVLQLASSAPQIYDLKLLHRQTIEALGLPMADKIVPMGQEIPAMDPVTENGALINVGQVQAKEYQDHEAHLRVHSSLLQDPQVAEMMQNSQTGPAISGAIDAHVREHTALLYRRQIEQELGTELPPLGQPVPEDVEKRLSVLAAEAAEMLLGKKQAMAQAEENAALQQDPVIQQKERELDIRQAEVERKRANDMTKAQIEAEKMQLQERLKQLELEQRREEAGLEAVGEIVSRGEAAELEGLKIGVQIAQALDDTGGTSAE